MAQLSIFGHSDDLIEIEGAVQHEFCASRLNKDYLLFSDGTVLYIGYDIDGDGYWRIKVVEQGLAELTLHHVEDEHDTATLDGQISWVEFSGDGTRVVIEQDDTAREVEDTGARRRQRHSEMRAAIVLELLRDSSINSNDLLYEIDYRYRCGRGTVQEVLFEMLGDGTVSLDGQFHLVLNVQAGAERFSLVPLLAGYQAP